MTVVSSVPGAQRVNEDGARPVGQFALRRVVGFFVLAYALSWAWTIPWAMTGHTVYQGRGWPTYLPGLLGPLAAALVVTARTAGRVGVKDLMSRMRRWRIGWRWWLAALSPVGFLAVGLIALGASGDVPARGGFAQFSGIPSALGLAGVALTMVVVGGLGEETGWRGYALPQLQRQFSPLTATLIVAAGWAGWHIPLFFYLDSYKSFRAPMVPVFVFGLACGAVVATWIYNRTGGSILAVAVWHGAYNMVGATKAATAGSGALSAVIWTLVVAHAVALLYLERRAHRLGRPSVIGPR
jgi:uncharacterized protein